MNSFLDEPDSDDDPPPFAQGVMRAVDADVLERKPNGGNGAAQHDEAVEPPPIDKLPEWADAPTDRSKRSHDTPSKPAPPSDPDLPPRYHLNWAELQNQTPPDRQWAIPGWIGMGHATLLVGMGGIGKTLITQQLLSCLSLGRAFIGSDAPPPKKCLMWACEDDHDELWRREIAVARWLKIGLDDLQGRFWIEPRLGLNNTMLHKTFGQPEWTELREQLIQQALDFEAEVIALDNVGQLFGANENDRHDVTTFVNGLSGALPGRAILLLGHPSRGIGSGFSGSSAWENVVRTRLWLGAELRDKPQPDEPDADTLYLQKCKTNYSTKDYMVLRFQDGLLMPEAQMEGGVVGIARKKRAETVMLAAVQQFYTRQIRTQHVPQSRAYVVRMIMEAEIADGVKKSDLTGALARLMADGKIVETPFGRSKDRHPQTTLAVG